MKKKILVIIPSFKHGGTNRSLLNLLSLVDIQRYNIDIFGMDPVGHYKQEFRNCEILPENIFITSLMKVIKEEKNIFRKLLFIIIRSFRRLGKKFKIDLSNVIFHYVAIRFSKNNYDAIIAYCEESATSFVSHIKASKKIAWIHCDYSEYLKLIGGVPEVKVYLKFDAIVCVSEYTKGIFIDCIPSLKDRVHAIHNTLDSNSMIELSKQNTNLESKFTNSEFTIVSIGRIDPIKRFAEIPKIVAEMKSTGYSFKWYLIGDGGAKNERKKLYNNITRYGVEDRFICLGEKDNPYPYIAASDLLVCTSISEGFSYVINEAKVLQTPVIVTNFECAKESIIDGEDGFIVPIENVSDKIKLLITDRSLYDQIKRNLSSFTYDNNVILEKIYEIIQ